MGILPQGQARTPTSKPQSSANTSLACLLPCGRWELQLWEAERVGLVGADKVIGIHGLMSPHLLPCWSRLGRVTIIYFFWASLLQDL